MKNIANAIAISVFSASFASDVTAQENDRAYTYPINDPLISWRIDQSGDFIEYSVCSEGETAKTFRWDVARFGAAHNCLLQAGTCARKIDTYPEDLNESMAEQRSITIPSAFLLDGNSIGDEVNTRVWCEGGSNGVCEGGARGSGLPFIRDTIVEYLLGDPALCSFTASDFADPQNPSLRIEIEVSEVDGGVRIAGSKSSSVGVLLALRGEVPSEDINIARELPSGVEADILPLGNLISEASIEVLATFVRPEVPAIQLLEEGFGERSGIDGAVEVYLDLEVANQLSMEAIVVYQGSVLAHFGIDGIIATF